MKNTDIVLFWKNIDQISYEEYRPSFLEVEKNEIFVIDFLADLRS